MRYLAMAVALGLAGCTGAHVLSRSPDGITVRPLDGDEQAAEDLAAAHCRQTGRIARLVGQVGYAGRRFECHRP